jgi:hypothetical protein
MFERVIVEAGLRDGFTKTEMALLPCLHLLADDIIYIREMLFESNQQRLDVLHLDIEDPTWPMGDDIEPLDEYEPCVVMSPDSW